MTLILPREEYVRLSETVPSYAERARKLKEASDGELREDASYFEQYFTRVQPHFRGFLETLDRMDPQLIYDMNHEPDAIPAEHRAGRTALVAKLERLTFDLERAAAKYSGGQCPRKLFDRIVENPLAAVLDVFDLIEERSGVERQ